MNTINAISHIFCLAAKEVLDTSTGKHVVYSDTIQKVPRIHLRPEIGCFVLFNGDYSGLMIMNFSADAALSIYRSSMIHMGMPEDELAMEYTSDEVVDSIGELINQIIGKVRRQVEAQYGLAASNTQPKAIALASSIVLSIDGHDLDREFCRRLSFKFENKAFHIELSLEKTEFISLKSQDVHELKEEVTSGSHKINIDDYQQEAAEKPKQTPAPDAFDFDKLKGDL